MQPPLVNEPLYKRIQRLKNEAAIANSATPNTVPTYTPEEKLVLWIKSLTPEQLKRPYKTYEVIRLASLTGKYRDYPALQEVAQILRKHGFEHKRNWAKANRNQRYWILKG